MDFDGFARKSELDLLSHGQGLLRFGNGRLAPVSDLERAGAVLNKGHCVRLVLFGEPLIVDSHSAHNGVDTVLKVRVQVRDGGHAWFVRTL